MAQGVVRLRLSEILAELGLTQKQFAQRTGLSQNAISNLISSPRQIRLDTLAAIIEATGKGIPDLLIYHPPSTSEAP